MSDLKAAFAGVTEWVFDLDNTLYPRHCDLFAQIDWKMTDYVSISLGLPKDEARILQKELYREYGTTLRGLMERYQINSQDFLDQVHDIDYSPVPPNPKLGELLAALPGRKLIFTNGDVPHANRTTDRLGVSHHFEGVFDIVASGLIPKPARGPYETFIGLHNVDPTKAVMFEDMPRNLEVPKAMGMKTVLIQPAQGSQHSAESWEHEQNDTSVIDFATDDLDNFLDKVLTALNS